MTYEEMYEEAAVETADDNGYYYKGYTGANALSLYVYDEYDVNAADNSTAHDALCEVL